VSRSHAVLGASEACVAVHPSDMAVALAALDAVVHTEGPDGGREIPIGELHRLPGQEPERDTVLEHGELITAVTLPPLELARVSTYRKVRERNSYAFALVSVAVGLALSADGVVENVRIAFGGVAHKPWRAHTAEDQLRGRTPTDEHVRQAAEAEFAPARALGDNDFKIPMAANALVAAIRDLAAEALA
jgi:xanthine dehydrogenase YagS FAD-binding subunit